jgi:endonuclease
MAIYDKPTKTLMLEFVDQNLKPGQIFDKKQAVEWFKARSVRKHHANVKPNSGHDLFFKVAPGKFRLWDKPADSAPIYRDQTKSSAPVSSGENEVSLDAEEVSESSQEFAFERDLRSYLSKNLASIENGLKVYQDEEFSGVEFPVGGRFINILAVDSRGDYVVIELKVSRGHERVVGQILRYMAWAKKHIASGKNVRGIIVANEITEDLHLAASMVPSLQLFEYAISMKLTPVASSV